MTAGHRGAPRRSQAIVAPILGMHRSGTSMFTRAVNLMGLNLGRPLMAPQADNPKGFWENEFFYHVNMRLLHALGCQVSGYGRVDGLLRIPDACARVERSAANLKAIEDYVDAQFGRSLVWGWKDPRSVLLFPFWLPVLVELGFRRVRPTVIARHPFAVVRSMARRTDLAGLAPALGCTVEALALEMWTAYNHILLDVCDATDCFVSVHEWLVDTPRARAELERGAAYLGLEAEEGPLAAALDWLDPSAVHHREPAPLDLPGADEALVLYEDLCARARSQGAAWRQARPRLTAAQSAPTATTSS